MSGQTLKLTGFPAVDSMKQGTRMVMLMGPGGALEPVSSGELAYDVASDTLSVKHLSEHAWAGPVNAAGQELREAEILGGAITGMASIEAVGGVAVGENLDVEGDAAVAGHMVVGGTVMGSGPYVDSSDARFKKAVRGLFEKKQGAGDDHEKEAEEREGDRNATSTMAGGRGSVGSGAAGGAIGGEGSALEALSRLRPVRYEFKREEFPERKFPAGEDLGFLAQELEQVLPELVVTKDENGLVVPSRKVGGEQLASGPEGKEESGGGGGGGGGGEVEGGYKYVAYAKLTPVLTAGVQELLAGLQEERARSAALATRVAALEDELERGRAKKAEDDGRLASRLERLEALLGA